MSTRAEHRCYLVCDGCGTEHPDMHEDVTSARITAAAEGWRYIGFKRRLPGPKGGQQSGPRTWDACPRCVLPDSVEAAQATIDERNT